MWICKDCGQDSEDSSNNCEICGADRANAETSTQPQRQNLKFFEIDGKKVRYAPSDNNSADSTTEKGDHG